MADTNPFDIKTGQNTGLIASQAPQVTGAQVAAPGPVQTAQAQTTQASTTGAAPAERANATLAATQRVNVDPAKQTVQGQLAGILASGNPLLVQAQTRAAQSANKRGLLNSSMAVGAGESALYDAAMPIAQSDADVYNKQEFTNADLAQQTELANAQSQTQTSQFNAGEANTTGRFNAGEANTTSRFNTGETNTAGRQNAAETNQNARFSAEQAQQTGTTNAQLAQQASLANAESQTKLMLQQLDANTRVEMTNIEANYKTLMQASQSASDLYSQTLKNISDITQNKDLDAAAKNAAIEQQKAYLQNGMNLIGSMNNLGIDQLLDFSAAPELGGNVEERKTTQPVDSIRNLVRNTTDDNLNYGGS